MSVVLGSEDRKFVIQGHPELHREFNGTLEYMSYPLKQTLGTQIKIRAIMSPLLFMFKKVSRTFKEWDELYKNSPSPRN